MIYYAIIATLYIAVLLFARPSPSSFRGKRISVQENVGRIKGSLFLGILLLTVQLFITNFTFLTIDENLLNIFTINNLEKENLVIFKYFTNIFIHFNVMHLLGNLFMLGLLSVYERKVGTRRFLLVFLISGLLSGFSIFFYSERIISAGASGAIFGLAAGFFTDDKNLTLKDWLQAIFMFLFLAIIISIRDFYEMQKLDMQIDYVGHALGAFGAIVFTRLYSRSSELAPN